jgi:hypothetical protein
MSAGASNSNLRVHNDLNELAPLFRAAVAKAIAECRAANLDAIVYEAYRTQELQSEYFARGRTKRPPLSTVTNAPSNLHSWHGYGLAVDVISESKRWDAGRKWFEDVAAIFERNNCKWGGRWKSADLPHFQWHKCKASPSDEARRLITIQGAQAVWQAVQAIGDAVLAEVRESEELTRMAVVHAQGLKLRPSPNTDNIPKRVLRQGTRLEVLEPHGAWFRVLVMKDDGTVLDDGFVHGNFITFEGVPAVARP